MFLVNKKLINLERNITISFSSFIPLFKEREDAILRRRFPANENQLRQIQVADYAHKLFCQSLSQTNNSTSFNLLKCRVAAILKIGYDYQSLLRRDKITFLPEEDKRQQFNISSFLNVYLRCARSLNNCLNEGIAKYYLSIVFFLLSLFLFVFSYFCMASFLTYLFVILSFCFGIYLIMAGLLDLLKSILLLDVKIKENLKCQWTFLPEEKQEDS